MRITLLILSIGLLATGCRKKSLGLHGTECQNSCIRFEGVILDTMHGQVRNIPANYEVRHVIVGSGWGGSNQLIGENTTDAAGHYSFAFDKNVINTSKGKLTIKFRPRGFESFQWSYYEFLNDTIYTDTFYVRPY